MKLLLYLIGYPILRQTNKGKLLIVTEILALAILVTHYSIWVLYLFPQMKDDTLQAVGMIILTILSLGALTVILLLHLLIATIFLLMYGATKAVIANYTYHWPNL